MDLKKTLEDLKKSYDTKVKYYEQVLTEKDKIEKELLRLEGAVSITSAMIKDGEEKNKDVKDEVIKKEE